MIIRYKLLLIPRLFQPGDYYQNAAIGRVVVHPDFSQKRRLGDELIIKSIEQIENQFKTNTIKIGAQTYLQKFYEKHGFIVTGEDYVEDGIPHIHMIRN